jgi:hypothetical protein
MILQNTTTKHTEVTNDNSNMRSYDSYATLGNC